MKFSIITVTLNSEKTLEKCMQSIDSQSYRNFEHIIIDGQSSDKTLEIINNNKKTYHKIISEADRGLWDAMNKGLKISSGDIVCFLNSDDTFNHNALKTASIYFLKYNIDFLFGSVKKYKLMHGYRPWKIKWSFGFYTSHSVGFFIKTKKHLDVGYYNEKYLSADLDLFYKMIVKNKLKGKATKKNEIFGKFSSGGFSSQVNFMTHLKDLNNIRIDNGQNKFFVYFLYYIKILKNFRKVINATS